MKERDAVQVKLYDRNFIFAKEDYFSFAPLLHVKCETILGRLFPPGKYSFAIVTNPRTKKIAIYKTFYEAIWLYLDGEEIENQ